MEGLTALAVSRPFPAGSELSVRVGDRVRPDTVVAVDKGLTRRRVIKLETDTEGVVGKVIKNVGDECLPGEPVGFIEHLMGLGYREYVSPVAGVVESFDRVSGFMVIRELPRPIQALLPGIVTEISDDHAVIVESEAVVFKGEAGAGEPSGGRLEAAEHAAPPFSPAPGRILGVPGPVDYTFLTGALRAGYAGVVCGGASRENLLRLSDHLFGLTRAELGARLYLDASGQAARTGPHDEVIFAVVCLGGYGERSMEPGTWRHLKDLHGRPAYLDGRMCLRGERIYPLAAVTVGNDD